MRPLHITLNAVGNLCRRTLGRCLPMLAAVAVMTGCSQRTPQPAEGGVPADTTREIAAHSLPMPQIPDSITSATARNDYAVSHFWQPMDFTDSNMTGDTLLMEQALSDYIALLGGASTDARRSSVASLLEKASADVMAYIHLMRLADKYLYTVDSPFRNDDLYRVFLEECIRDNTLTEPEKETMRAQLAQIRTAAQGTPAPDIKVRTATSQPVSLRSLVAGAPMALILFYDHDCTECRDALSRLAENTSLATLSASGSVKVVTIDINDTFVPLSVPATSWIQAGATGSVDEAYVVRNTPSVYALDRNGNILLKDVTVSEVENLIKR